MVCCWKLVCVDFSSLINLGALNTELRLSLAKVNSLFRLLTD
jgi:hypothetical protein